jgi:ketosteroid isomerase-like protein
VTRTLLGGCALAGIVVALTAVTAGCGGTSKASAADAQLQREADLYQIDQIEAKFHQATSTQNLKLMMSLFAPGAVFNVDEQTLTGKAQIRQFFATEAGAFQPGNHWESDTPSYKLRATVNGDKGTLYFECHYIDPKTQKVVNYVAVQHQVQKIDGKWLITNSAASPAVLSP